MVYVLFFLWFHLFGDADVNKGHNFGWKLILWSFNNNNELLAHLRTNFKCELLLKLFRNWVFNEPAVELDLSIFDLCFVLVIERQLISIILAKNFVTIVEFSVGNGHRNNLIFCAEIAKQQSRPQNFSANKLAIIYDIWINIQNLVNVITILFFLGFG